MKKGAMTFGITTLKIMTLSVTQQNITFSIPMLLFIEINPLHLAYRCQYVGAMTLSIKE